MRVSIQVPKWEECRVALESDRKDAFVCPNVSDGVSRGTLIQYGCDIFMTCPNRLVSTRSGGNSIAR